MAETFELLLGTWSLSRHLEDMRSGSRGQLDGTVSVLEMVSDDLPDTPRRARYEERGQLRFGRYSGPATRVLGLVRREGGAALLRFSDGRDFVELDLTAGACERVHACGADRYEITTTMLSADVLEERWRVRGPAKDYSAVTTLTRSRP